MWCNNFIGKCCSNSPRVFRTIPRFILATTFVSCIRDWPFNRRTWNFELWIADRVAHWVAKCCDINSCNLIHMDVAGGSVTVRVRCFSLRKVRASLWRRQFSDITERNCNAKLSSTVFGTHNFCALKLYMCADRTHWNCVHNSEHISPLLPRHRILVNLHIVVQVLNRSKVFLLMPNQYSREVMFVLLQVLDFLLLIYVCIYIHSFIH